MKVKLHHIQDEAPNIRTYFFKPEQPIRYVAGQFIELTLPHAEPDNRGVRRWFTLSSAPGHELVSITTKHAYKPSSFKAKLWELQPDATLDMSEPMGDFVLPKDETQPLVFVAGGIGITPFHSIVQWLVDTEQIRKIQFLCSISDESEALFRQLFKQPYIDVHEYISRENLTADKIIELVDGIDGKQLFISGPEPMTEDIVEQFKKNHGMTQNQLITDYFPGYKN